MGCRLRSPLSCLQAAWNAAPLGVTGRTSGATILHGTTRKNPDSREFGLSAYRRIQRLGMPAQCGGSGATGVVELTSPIEKLVLFREGNVAAEAGEVRRLIETADQDQVSGACAEFPQRLVEHRV